MYGFPFCHVNASWNVAKKKWEICFSVYSLRDEISAKKIDKSFVIIWSNVKTNFGSNIDFNRYQVGKANIFIRHSFSFILCICFYIIFFFLKKRITKIPLRLMNTSYMEYVFEYWFETTHFRMGLGTFAWMSVK